MTCAADLDVSIGGYNGIFLGDSTVYKTYFPEITSTEPNVVEIHAYTGVDWINYDVSFGIGTSTVPTFKLYPEVYASFPYSNVFTAGVYETIGTASYYGVTVDLGSTIDRNAIGTY